MKKHLSMAMVLAAGLALAPEKANSADLIAHWDFEKIEADGITIKASTGNFEGVIRPEGGGPILTDATGGRPNGGSRGFDISQANPGWLFLEAEGAANPMTAAAVEDSMTVVLWEKNNSNINSSSFWAIGPENDRAFQFHIPWSDGTIYFDTAGGCCATPGQRLSMNVETAIPGFDWLAWHHYAFVKDGGRKAVYVDGILLVSQDEGADPLPTEYTALTIGGQNNSSPPDAVIDDVAIYKGALTEAEIKDLAAGASPGVPKTDTDADGMPDDWETQYGFNPTDPSDAALDADNDGVTNLNEFKAGTDPKDTTAPTLVSAVSSATFNSVVLTFSEKVDPTTAAALANYSVSPALALSAPVVKGSTVTFTTAAQTPGGTAYTVTATGVKDTSNNTIAGNNTATFYSFVNLTSGILKFSYWGNVVPTGTDVQLLLDDPRYPNSPDLVMAATAFDTRTVFPTDSHEQYGATIGGVLTAPETGTYNFFLRSDDASQLLFSTDPTGAGAQVIAEETGCCDPFMAVGEAETSGDISLTAGSKYFLQAIYKEGGGGDYAQVAWRKTTDTTPPGALLPMPGKFFEASAPSSAEGRFLSQTPAANAADASASLVQIVHIDGKTALTEANTSLLIDNAPVTATVLKEGSTLTVTYVPSPALAPKSSHTAKFNYIDVAGNPAALEWSFTTAAVTKDVVSSRIGDLKANAVFTADAGGRSGQAGDFGLDLPAKGGGYVVVPDGSFLNAAGAKDELSIAFWQKKYDIAASSAFWAVGVGQDRAFQGHVPWSDNTIYFDTAGCCVADEQRISLLTTDFPDYTPATGITWWTANWNFFVFSKKDDLKQVWINGKLFFEGAGALPMPTEFLRLHIGSDSAGGGRNHAIMDDVSVYSTGLAPADITSLHTGTLPTALPASAGLLAYWNFNDGTAVVVTPTLAIEETATGIKITYTGVLQSAASSNGPYTDLAGATSPYETAAAGGAAYYRAIAR